MFFKEIDDDRDPESHWSNYSRVLSSKVYKIPVAGNQRD
jgi:hypothetical protein